MGNLDAARQESSSGLSASLGVFQEQQRRHLPSVMADVPPQLIAVGDGGYHTYEPGSVPGFQPAAPPPARLAFPVQIDFERAAATKIQTQVRMRFARKAVTDVRHARWKLASHEELEAVVATQKMWRCWLAKKSYTTELVTRAVAMLVNTVSESLTAMELCDAMQAKPLHIGRVRELITNLREVDRPIELGSGRTALHVAVTDANPEIVRLLLEREADPMMEDRDGQTPGGLASALAKYARHAMDNEAVLLYSACLDALLAATPIEAGGGRDTSPAFVFDSAAQLLRARRFEDALAGFLKAAEGGHAAPSRCYNGAGMCLANLGRDAAAVKQYTASINRPRRPAAFKPPSRFPQWIGFAWRFSMAHSRLTALSDAFGAEQCRLWMGDSITTGRSRCASSGAPTVRALPGRLSALGVSTVNRFCAAFLYGRGGRSMAPFGGSRPGRGRG
jgi:hypothetical protein